MPKGMGAHDAQNKKHNFQVPHTYSESSALS